MRAISWVAAPCSSMAAEIEAVVELIYAMVWEIPSMAPTAERVSI